jgi:hypothetical protein
LITQEQLNAFKAQGRNIITAQTWRKWLDTGKLKSTKYGYKLGIGSVPVYEYFPFPDCANGQLIRHEWHLTYMHREYEELIPVDEKDLMEYD